MTAQIPAPKTLDFLGISGVLIEEDGAYILDPEALLGLDRKNGITDVLIHYPGGMFTDRDGNNVLHLLLSCPPWAQNNKTCLGFLF